MKKLILIIAACAIVTSCGSDHHSEERKVIEHEVAVYDLPPATPIVPTTSYSYTIINKIESAMIISDNQELKKITYTLEIPSEYSQSALEEIADVIKHEDNHKYIFIEYYLPTQPKNGPNYGISKRIPTESSSTINYIAPPTPPAPEVKAPYDGCKVYGKWNMMGASVIAYQKGGRCYMVNYYGGSNYGDPELYYKTTYQGGTAFKNSEDPNDVYVINSNGDLDGYYAGDYAGTFAKAN